MTLLGLYRAVGDVGGPLIRLYLANRRARGKEDAARFGERLGRPGRPRPSGPLVWAHAASVGESLSLLPLIDRLRADRPDRAVLVTTGTLTSARLMAERLPAGALHQYVPADRRPWVRRFLDHWRPDAALWVESEIWPMLVTETALRGIPMVLINGRISERSLKGWQRHPVTIARLLGAFGLCLAQTDDDARRLRVLGAGNVACVGNLKTAAPPLPADPTALADLEQRLAGRPLWLAASTHAGEEAIAGRVHRRLKAGRPDLLTLVAPRHPPRGPAVAAELASLGLGVAVRSRGDRIDAATDIYLADTMGELGLFYRLAPLVFVGKTLAGAGGQNPLEPAHLDCAILFGPAMDNFAEMAARLTSAGAAAVVADEAALADAVARLLTDAPAREAMAGAARAVAQAEAGVLDAVVEAIRPFIDLDPPSRASA